MDDEDPDYVMLPDAERIDELGSFVEWLVNAKPGDETDIRSEIDRYYYAVGHDSAGDALNQALTEALAPGVGRKERRAILKRLDRFTRIDPAEAARAERGLQPRRWFQVPVFAEPEPERRNRFPFWRAAPRPPVLEAAYKLYLRKGEVFLPTTARIDNDLLHDIFITMAPVDVIQVGRTALLAEVIAELMAAGNPPAAWPPPRDFACPERDRSGLATWAEFQRGARMWVVTLVGSACKVLPYVRVGGGEPELAPVDILTLPAAPLQAAAAGIVGVLQAAARRKPPPRDLDLPPR